VTGYKPYSTLGKPPSSSMEFQATGLTANKGYNKEIRYPHTCSSQ
jgi:hypothetical protein